jgi:hypothetical protein
MSNIKLIMTVSLAVAVLTMITSSQPSILASSTTEDDGWVEGEDDSQGEISSQEELEEAYEGSQWEDDIGPNEFEEATNNDDDDDKDNDDDNRDDEEQTFTCSDGSTVTEDEQCPSTVPNLYCDLVSDDYRGSCHDRKDASDTKGLYTCNDGTHKDRWQDCEDATKNDNDNKPKVIEKTTVIHNPSASASATATAIAAEESGCRLDGSADGIVQKFNSVRYQACGLYTNGQLAYSDGFVVGCTQIGNTQLICQALVDSSIINMKTQSIQITTTQPTQPTQTQPQPTQAIQTQSTTQPTQAIQPSDVS